MKPLQKKNLLYELTLPISIFQYYRTQQNLLPFHNTFSKHPVIVLPGLGASDSSTKALRGFLRKTGLWVYGWKQGYNHGRVGKLLPSIIDHAAQVYAKHDQKVILIGWSLGGLIAREVARQIPKYIQGVCTMGSPLIGGPKHTLYAPLYKKMGHDLEKTAEIIHNREKEPLLVPSQVMYSKKDGIVHWEACLDHHNPHTTHAEVQAPHFSMGTSPEIFIALHNWLKTILPANQVPDQN